MRFHKDVSSAKAAGAPSRSRKIPNLVQRSSFSKSANLRPSQNSYTWIWSCNDHDHYHNHTWVKGIISRNEFCRLLNNHMTFVWKSSYAADLNGLLYIHVMPTFWFLEQIYNSQNDSRAYCPLWIQAQCRDGGDSWRERLHPLFLPVNRGVDVGSWNNGKLHYKSPFTSRFFKGQSHRSWRSFYIGLQTHAGPSA